MQKIITLMFLMLLFALSIGCSSGLDRTFDTSSEEALGKSVQKMLLEASEEEAKIFKDHAPVLFLGLQLQQLKGSTTDLSQLTGRQVLVNFLNNKIQEKEKVLIELGNLKAISSELQKIKLENIKFSLASGFMNSGEPEISLDVTNGSSIPIHTIEVRSLIYLDKQAKPAADSKSYYVFKEGLPSGASQAIKISPGGAFGNDGGWGKLSIKKAINPRVNVILVEIKDYDSKTIKVFNPEEMQAINHQLEKLKKQLAVVG